jgi:hypothetical protein
MKKKQQQNKRIKEYKGFNIEKTNSSKYYLCKEFPALKVSKIKTIEKCIDVYLMHLQTDSLFA